MIEDYAAPTRDYRRAVARQFEAVAERFEKISEAQQQQMLVLTEMQVAMKAITETLEEQKTDAKHKPALVRDWLYLAIAVGALLLSLLSFMESHVTLH